MAETPFAERQAMSRAGHDKMAKEFAKQSVVERTVAALGLAREPAGAPRR